MKDEKKKGNIFGIRDFIIRPPNQKKFDLLQHAIIDGIPNFKVGDRLIIQRPRGDSHIGVCEVIAMDEKSCTLYDMSLGQCYGFHWTQLPDVRLPD